MDRIKKNLGVPWRDGGYRDTYKAGAGLEMEVTGVATTSRGDDVRRDSAGGGGWDATHDHSARGDFLERSRRYEGSLRRSALPETKVNYCVARA